MLDIQIEQLLDRHGICIKCGQMYSHEIVEPFAGCGCHNTEWGCEYTPYQLLEYKIYTLEKQLEEEKANQKRNTSFRKFLLLFKTNKRNRISTKRNY